VTATDPNVRRAFNALLASNRSYPVFKSFLSNVQIDEELQVKVMQNSRSVRGQVEPGLEVRRRSQVSRSTFMRERGDFNLLKAGEPFPKKSYAFRTPSTILETAMIYIKDACNGDINPSKLHSFPDGTQLNFFRNNLSYERLYEGYRSTCSGPGAELLSKPYFTELARMISRKDRAKTCVLAPLVDYKTSVSIVIVAIHKVGNLLSIFPPSTTNLDEHSTQILGSGSLIEELLAASERFAEAGGFYGHIRIPRQGYETPDDSSWCDCDGDSFHCAGYSNGADCSKTGEPHNETCAECLQLRLGPELAMDFFETTLNVLKDQNQTNSEFLEGGRHVGTLNDSIMLASQLISYSLAYYASLCRGKSQNYALKHALQASPSSIVAVVDYMNGFLPRKYLEPMADYFGKVGLGVLVCMFQYLDNGKVKSHFLDLVLSSNTHSAQDFISIIPLIRLEAARLGRFDLILQSDNASGFASHDIIPYIFDSNRTESVYIREFVHTEAGMGKTQADGHMCYLKVTAVESSNNKMNITTPEEFYYALGGAKE
jgi:hypothetical protein